MSTENTPVEQVDTSLDDFSAEFFGQNNAEADTAKSEQVEAEVPESDAPTIEDTHEESTEDGTSEVEDDDANDETTDTEAEKPKKSRFQERIDELTAKAREAERRAEEAFKRLEELEKSKQEAPKNDEPTQTDKPVGPQPTDLNDDGTEKYPLGEFDPAYLRDHVDFLMDQREAERTARQAKEAEQAKLDAEAAALKENWNSKLAPAQERYPDFLDKGQAFVDSFQDLDSGYGEYLTSALMAMDHGPDVLYYLASNPDEARAIVNSGPVKATIALGGINARFAVSAEEVQDKQNSRPKVSKAPTPPSRINKGSSAAMPEVPGDTDDLDAFERELFKPRRR